MVSEQPQSRRDTMVGSTPQMGGGSRQGSSGADVTGGAKGNSPAQTDMGAKAQDVAQQTQEKVGQVVDQAKEQATNRLSMQKDRAVDSLGTVVTALRQTSQHLKQSNQAGIAEYAEKAADRVEQFSGQLRGKDVQTIVRDMEVYARRQPALFLGGAFVLGLLGARFLKSTAQREDDGDMTGYTNRPGYYSGSYRGQYGGQYDQPYGSRYSGQYGRQYGGQYGGQYGSGAMGARPAESGTGERNWYVRGTETR
jgi:hypothetical protein